MNTELSLVTVIVPVYNVERYLRRCLDSLLTQTYSRLEIICVDDGSTDGSGSILDEYGAEDSRVIVVHQENRGLPGARNRALDMMHGTWVTGVDADDWLEHHAIERALQFAKPDVDIVWFGLQVVTDKGFAENEYYRPKYQGKQSITPELLSCVNVNFCAKLWRRSLIDRCGARFVPEMWFEDNYFFFTVAPYAERMAFCTDKLYFRYMRADSIMGQTFAKKSEKSIDYLRVREAVLKEYRRRGLPEVLGRSPAWIEAWLVRDAYIFTRRNVPRMLRSHVRREALRLVREYGLAQYRVEVNPIRFDTPFFRLFVRYMGNEVQYRILGLTIWRRRLPGSEP